MATKPSSEEVRDVISSCENIYADLWEKYEEDEKYYELDFKSELDLPDEFAQDGVVLPTGRDMIDAFVDNIDLYNARVNANKKGTTNISDEKAEAMRKFGAGVIYRNMVEQDISPFRVAGKHFAQHGLGVLKTVYDKRRDFPIVISGINPRNIMPDPTYGQRQYIIEKHRRTRFDMERMFPKWTNPEDKKTTDAVEWIQFWSKDWRFEFVDNEVVLNGKNTYGFIPYVLIETGLGNISIENKPEMRYVGILRYMIELLKSESRDYSIADIILKKRAFPWTYMSGSEGQVVEIDQRYGFVNQLPQGVTIQEVESKMPPDALAQHLAITSDYISSHAAPRSVRGLSESGVRSGADRRLVLSQAALKYQYATEAFKHGVAKVLSNCAELYVKIVPDNLQMFAETPTDKFDVEIKKELLQKPYVFYVDFAPISEEDEYRRHDDLERLTASGIVTPQWARTQMSNVDPLAMELDAEKTMIKNSPMVQQIIGQYVAGKLAAAIGQRELAEQAKNPPAPVQQMPQQGTQPLMDAGRGLVAPIPNRAPLGSGGDLQNQMAGMRSQTSPNPMQGIGGGGNRP